MATSYSRDLRTQYEGFTLSLTKIKCYGATWCGAMWSAIPDAPSVIVMFVIFAVDGAVAPELPMTYTFFFLISTFFISTLG